jgi:hypothetical protein
MPSHTDWDQWSEPSAGRTNLVCLSVSDQNTAETGTTWRSVHRRKRYLVMCPSTNTASTEESATWWFVRVLTQRPQKEALLGDLSEYWHSVHRRKRYSVICPSTDTASTEGSATWWFVRVLTQLFSVRRNTVDAARAVNLATCSFNWQFKQTRHSCVLGSNSAQDKSPFVAVTDFLRCLNSASVGHHGVEGKFQHAEHAVTDSRKRVVLQLKTLHHKIWPACYEMLHRASDLVCSCEHGNEP